MSTRFKSIMPQLRAMQEGDVLTLEVPAVRYQRRRRSTSIRNIVSRWAVQCGHKVTVSLKTEWVEVKMIEDGLKKASNFAVQA